MAGKYSHDQLVARMKSPGWRLKMAKQDALATGSLEQVLKVVHELNRKGEAPSLIEEIETEVELDMLQIEKLWLYLGLPL